MTFTPHTIDPGLDLEHVRDVPVTPEAVFAAWTDPESLKQWFAPRPYSVPLVRDRPATWRRVPNRDERPRRQPDDGQHRLLSSRSCPASAWCGPVR